MRQATSYITELFCNGHTMGAPILDVRLLIPIVDHLLILWPVVTFTEAFVDEQAMIKTRRKRKRITNFTFTRYCRAAR